MLSAGLAIVAGICLLYGGAEGLVRGSSGIALRLRVSPLMIGLTVAAYGTSSPEFIVSLKAAMIGSGDIVLGNVVGSNIANIALVLGASAMIRPLRVSVQLVRLDVPIMIGASLILIFFLRNAGLSRLEGGILFLGVIVYNVMAIFLARRQKNGPDQGGLEKVISSRPKAFIIDGLMIACGLYLLMLGANLLVEGALHMAERWGLSQAVIGLTIVAVGTSLPELATSMVASARGDSDIAVGNAVGSCIFNILAILGASALFHPIFAGGVGVIDLAAMMILSVLLLPLLRTGFRLSRLEGSCLLFFYGLYLSSLVLWKV